MVYSIRAGVRESAPLLLLTTVASFEEAINTTVYQVAAALKWFIRIR